MTGIELLNKESYNEDEAVLLFNIAHALEDGIVLQKNDAMSHGILQLLAEKAKLAPALYRLAEQYAQGIGCEKDLPQAIKTFTLLADNGDINAIYNLGQIYATGKYGAEVNAKEAYGCFKKGEEQKNAKCAYCMAECLAEGFGTEKDDKRALEIFGKLINNPNIDANLYFYLGLFWQEGRGGLERNYEEAREWFRRGALQNNALCYNQLGVIYSLGLGVTVDYNAGCDYYLIASKLGDRTAKCNLAYCYETGQGITRDKQKAIELYTEAAQAGESHAREALKRLQASTKIDEIVCEGVNGFKAGMRSKARTLFAE